MTLKIEALLPPADVEKYCTKYFTEEHQKLFEAIFDRYAPIIEKYASDLGAEYAATLPFTFTTSLLIVELILQEGAERPN